MPFAADLPLEAELVRAEGPCWSFRLRLGDGEVFLDAERHPEYPKVPVSRATLRHDSRKSAARLARGVASWLGVAMPAATVTTPPSPVDLFVFSLGGADGRAQLELAFETPDRYAEVFLNVDTNDDSGVLKEKDVAMRAELVELLRRATGDVPGLPAVSARAQLR